MKYVLFALLAYLLYQFIFNLVIPVYKTTQKVKKGFREMSARMEEQMKQQNGNNETTAQPKTGAKPKAGDYLDYEEIK